MEALKQLESPFEFLDLPDCSSIILKPVDWQFGTARVHPPWLPEGVYRTTNVLRIHVLPADKPLFPHYYDFGQKTLVPQVMSILTAGIPADHAIKIHAVGVGPKKRFQVSLVPV